MFWVEIAVDKMNLGIHHIAVGLVGGNQKNVSGYQRHFDSTELMHTSAFGNHDKFLKSMGMFRDDCVGLIRGCFHSDSRVFIRKFYIGISIHTQDYNIDYKIVLVFNQFVML